MLLRGHLRGESPAPRRTPPISILKPLCGVDDELEENLAVFSDLDYPEYEVMMLGVKSTQDAAYPVACAAARRWPGRFRVVSSEASPGSTPR